MPKLSEPPLLSFSAFVTLQHLLPHHLLSRLVWLATRARLRPWKNLLIRIFLRHYPVDMSEAAQPDPTSYASFNAFFTRALRARALEGDARAILSPVDGVVSAAGRIEGERLIQAKGRHYTLAQLLAGAGTLAERFAGGTFATIYLAPHHYHRVHMPVAGRLLSTHHVGGRLFSVNQATTRRVPRLFARNERVVCVFEGVCGVFAVVLVGALFVGSISTVWAGEITPAWGRGRALLPPPPDTLTLAAGAELGRFNMGSTVIVLFEPEAVHLDPALSEGAEVRMGGGVGRLAGGAGVA